MYWLHGDLRVDFKMWIYFLTREKNLQINYYLIVQYQLAVQNMQAQMKNTK